MLRNVKDLRGYSIRATDGAIGTVDDFYFDDEGPDGRRHDRGWPVNVVDRVVPPGLRRSAFDAWRVRSTDTVAVLGIGTTLDCGTCPVEARDRPVSTVGGCLRLKSRQFSSDRLLAT